MTFVNGDFYSGDFKNDLRNGKGEYVWKDGSKYVGDFIDDKKEGNGKLVFANKDRYVGQFSNDKRNGKGKYIFHRGDIMKEIGKMMLKKVKEFMFIEMDKNIQEILKMI